MRAKRQAGEIAAGFIDAPNGKAEAEPKPEAVGGYPELPLMEDVEMVRRLRRRGGIARLPGPLPTSPRTYLRLGRWKVWLRNGAVVCLYLAGVAPERLARWYPERFPDPANELAAAREWLGAAGVGFRPQEGDDLGERLADAFRREFRRAPQVCAIGTDAPAVDRRVVEGAFAELSAHDLVLGPALDGGYDLIGATGYWPDLFRDVAWSTGGVMSTTLARARALKLRTAALEPLPDIDTVEDLERAGISRT